MPEQKRPAAEPFESRLEFETLLADLSSRFINLPPGEVDREIQHALRRVCESLGIDLAVLWQWSGADPDVIRATHFHSAQDAQPPAEPLSEEQFPWARREMLAGRVVLLRSLDDFPAEATIDRESCSALGIKSNLTLPLAVAGAPPVGALGFNTRQSYRDWPEALVKRLQLVAQVFTNALARRRTEVALRESEERLALTVDSAGAGLWVLDYHTGVFWTTERGRAIFGYSPDEVVDIERFEASVHPDDRELVRGVIERAAHAGEPVNVEYRIILPGDGSVRWVSSRGRPHFTPAGEVERLMGTSVDITDRKVAEEEHRAGQARLEAGADLAGLGFYEVDYGRGIAFFDARICDLLGLPHERVQGLESVAVFKERVYSDDRPRFFEQAERLEDGRLEEVDIEYRFVHPTRGVRWLHHVARVAARDAGRHTLRSFGAVRDTTERRQREEALRQSLAEIERLKDRLQAESDYLKAEIKVVHPHGEIIGRSATIKKVLRLVEQVAPTDSTVLIRGETGTGKELIAQAIHRLSSRGGRLMVKVNCAALPTGLLESELFGRERGAYTGALTRQIGRFEVADDSTVFLDEVGELAPEVQAKLLRVLEAGEFERLGSPRTIKVDVRVIAATNRDLAEDVRQGRFREDLYYRLNVFPIRVPPLRERAEDVPLLAWAFLEEFSSRMGKKITKVPRRTMEALQLHSWPGNVRELRNIIEHAAIITEGDALRVSMFDEAAAVAEPPQTLAESERQFILRALERARWRIKGPQGAAAQLGLKPSTLYGRMKKLGIRPPAPADDDVA